MRTLIAFALVASTGIALDADVVDKAANGFTVRTVVTINAPADRVYAALARIGDWWSSDHTWSGKAANLRLEPRAGGCLCETLEGGGSVQHAVVVMADPGKTLRLHGALGPLQELGVAGALTWALTPAGTGTTATVTYAIGGYMNGGIDRLAAPVDQVIAEQLRRLKAHVEQTTR